MFIIIDPVTNEPKIVSEKEYLVHHNIRTITKEKYNSLHKDYKGVWSSDNIHGTNYDGKKTMLHWDNGTCLLIEGVNFIIVDSEEKNINPLKK